MQTLYQLALVSHITGICLMGGTTLMGYVLSLQFWKFYDVDKSKALALEQAKSKFPVLFGIGFLLVILSGITMMAITRGAFGEQIWFRIKFGLILTIVLNALFIGRPQQQKLSKLLSLDGAVQDMVGLLKVRMRMGWFYISQMAFFLVIFTLSVFKFN